MFQSHCAPEPPAAKEDPAAALAKLTVAALKAKLQALGQPLTGRKVRPSTHADMQEMLAVHGILTVQHHTALSLLQCGSTCRGLELHNSTALSCSVWDIIGGSCSSRVVQLSQCA